jgi:YjbE family integral membrane protein
VYPATIVALATSSAEPAWHWWLAIPSIVLIDVVLAGDNAVIIALAARQLDPSQRLLAISVGSALAVILRVVLTFFAAQLLALNYVHLIGGGLVLWIAVKLLTESAGDEDTAEPGKTARSLWSAVQLILIADLSMSIDNVLAVAAASHGQLVLLILGLGLSIPLVVFSSNVLAQLMDRYPIIAWLGAALLGKVAAEMIVVDHLFFPNPNQPPQPWLVHAVGAAGALAVVLTGWCVRQVRARKATD